MKKFMTEFKEFIAKGNVMTMAVGIIIGGAFTAIINSVVADVISPIIGLILGGTDFSALSFGVGDAQIMIGNLINAHHLPYHSCSSLLHHQGFQQVR